jgi:hypothetical protein
LVDFRAASFDLLDNASLGTTAKKLQAVGGFGFRDVDATEAWNTLRVLRED